MTTENATLARLVEAAAAADRRRIAVGVVRAFKEVNSIVKPTAQENAELAAADAACLAADGALAAWRLRAAS
jgi:hypothetical protein